MPATGVEPSCNNVSELMQTILPVSPESVQGTLTGRAGRAGHLMESSVVFQAEKRENHHYAHTHVGVTARWYANQGGTPFKQVQKHPAREVLKSTHTQRASRRGADAVMAQSTNRKEFSIQSCSFFCFYCF